MDVEIIANDIHYKNHEISFDISVEKNRVINIDWIIKAKNGEEIKKDCSSLAQAIFYIDNFILDKK